MCRMVLYGKQYCDIDPSDLCITQDKKNRAKKPYDEQGNRKKIAANNKTDKKKPKIEQKTNMKK